VSNTTLPEGLRYGPEHEWTSVDEHGIATVGITDYAQDQLGDVQYVDHPVIGSTVIRGAVLLEVESTKTVSEVYAPVSGEVVEINELLVDEPEHLNDDPYGAWLCRIKPADPVELDSLLTAEQYRARIEG
jgi:glycine cleavage system H protein